MSTFHYKARQKDGAIVDGDLEAASLSAAQSALLEKDILVLSLVEKRPSFLQREIVIRPIKRREIVVFSRQLAVMASASLPLVQALRIMEQQVTNPYLKRVVVAVSNEISAGAKLSQALSLYQSLFGNFYVAMVRSGEASGKLDEVLGYLADEEEKDYDLASKIHGAMIYPAFIVCGLVVIGFVLMIFVVPKLTEIVRELGGELPWTTRVLIASSDFFTHWWWLAILLIVGVIGGSYWYTRRPSGHWVLDYIKLRMPIFGTLFQKIAIIRLTRSISTLVQGGIPLTQGLRITAEVVGNDLYRDLVLKTIQEVEDGRSIATVFARRSDLVPPMLASMMVVGEQTGKLDAILAKLADFYSREVDNMVRNMSSLIEPLIIVLLGVAVGGIVAAVILPIYNLSTQF